MQPKHLSRISFIIFFFSYSLNYAQYQTLKVGDKVPNYTLRNLVNYQKKKTTLKEFQGKLLILDFWATTCASCLKSWPKLLSLQKKFDGKVQIILINTDQTYEDAKPMIERREKILKLKMTLPSVYYDTIIKQLFPYSGIPHIVWIGKDGYVKSITGGDVLNEETIESFLTGNEVDLYQKTKKDFEWDMFEPLFGSNMGGDSIGLISHSVLTKYVEGLPYLWYTIIDPKRNVYQINALNSSIKDMYRFAYSNYFNFFMHRRHKLLERVLSNRVVLNLRDSSKVIGERNGVYILENYFTYQFVSPPATLGQLQLAMQSDLKRFYGFNVSWEKVAKPCLVFSSRDTTVVSSKGGKDRVIMTDDISMKANNVTMDMLLNCLELTTDYYYSPFPLINETGIKGNIGPIDIQADIMDYKELNKALKKYGLSVSLENRVVDVMVISEPKTDQTPAVNFMN